MIKYLVCQLTFTLYKHKTHLITNEGEIYDGSSQYNGNLKGYIDPNNPNKQLSEPEKGARMIFAFKENILITTPISEIYVPKSSE
ncbi:MAG: hypothetical protein QXM68_03070 [Candidatus Aenigmatarchaeota archaeon]|nr:hypothetical protein [Candidatus Aenigmarchaeota archaeon]